MNVAFIPVRGGSKSIPLKNIKQICGKPLVYWTMSAACRCKYIDKVYIATDSDDIASVVKDLISKEDPENVQKVEIIGRSAESASDVATTESAMLEFADKYDFNMIALIQATSPLLQPSDLDRGFEAMKHSGVDSVLSAVPQKKFNWEIVHDGYAKPSNYDVYNRPRRQEFRGYLVENGAFYITSKTRLLQTKNRISGNIKAVEMCEESFWEIDEPEDWGIIEILMKERLHRKVSVPNIKMFLTDCDGCLTDGGMYYTEKGDEMKKFNTRDGMGFSLLNDRGVLTGIVTSEVVKINHRRAEKLKIDILKDGCRSKLETVRQLCEEYNISLANVCYIGDDLNDAEVMKAVGFGCCPGDASEQIQRIAHMITKANGGQGVIREVVDQLIKYGKV